MRKKSTESNVIINDVFDFKKMHFENVNEFQRDPRDSALSNAAAYGVSKKLPCMFVSFGQQPSGLRAGTRKTSTSLQTSTANYVRLVSQTHPEIQLYPNHPQVVGTVGSYYVVRSIS